MKKVFLSFILFSTLTFSQDGSNMVSIAIDSSLNGYGLFSNRTKPIGQSEDGSIHMIYRKLVDPDFSGHIGYAGIDAGGIISLSTPINEYLPDGYSEMSNGRYPSILVASDGTRFAIWNEYTLDGSGGGNSGGRLFINFDNQTWFMDIQEDSMFDLNNNCLDDLPCSPINDLWLAQPFLLETPNSYDIHLIAETWSNNDYVYIKSSINKETLQITNDDPIIHPMSWSSFSFGNSADWKRQFSMNKDGKSSFLKLNDSNGSAGFTYFLYESPDDILNDELSFYIIDYDRLKLLGGELFNVSINQIEQITYDHGMARIDNNGTMHIFAYISFEYGQYGGYYHLSNTTPENIETWDIELIYLDDLDEGATVKTSDFTFTFEYQNETLSNVYFILQYEGDLFSFTRNFDGWQEGENLTNSNEFEWGVHAISNTHDGKIPFIYNIIDSTLHSIPDGNLPADWKQKVYLGILNENGGLSSSGNIVINEIMQNPSSVSDNDGEWFEIYNDSQDTVDLAGWKIKDYGTDEYTISNGVIYPQQYFLFVANGNQDENGGISNYDYIYDRGEFNLGNSSDEIILTTPLGGVVDQVVYGDELNFPDPNGKSMELLYYRYDNMNGDNWVESNNQLPSGDYGTPGQENSFIAPIIDVVEVISHQENLIVNPIDWNNPGTSDCLINDSMQPNECDTAFFSVVISNAGSGELIFNSHKLEDVYNPLDYISRWEFHNELPISISPGSSDTLSISFIPWREIDDLSPWIGSRQNTLYLKNNNNDEYDTEINFSTIIKLNGAGYALEIDESPYSYWEDISSSPTLVIPSQYGNSVILKMVSYGTESIEVDEVYIDSDYFTIDAGDGSVEFGDHIEIYLEFNPPSDGVFIDTVSIESSADLFFPALFNAQSTTPDQQFIVKGTTDTLSLKIEGTETIPHQFNLYQNIPNPFNPITSLRYDLPEDGLVNITIYDMMGRVVKTLLNGSQTAGFKLIQWNATNNRNEPVSAGLYLYAIQAGEFRQTRKMVLLK